jgi:hypothetical protein
MLLLIVAQLPPLEPYLDRVVQFFEFVQCVNCKLSIHKPLHIVTEPIYEPASEIVTRIGLYPDEESAD